MTNKQIAEMLMMMRDGQTLTAVEYRNALNAAIGILLKDDATKERPDAGAHPSADAARLDWLDRDDIEIFPMTDAGGNPFVEIWNKSDRMIGKGQTLRAAIDSAMTGSARQDADKPTTPND